MRVCSLAELEPGRGAAALVDGTQVAIFLLPGEEKDTASRLRAVDNRDPVAGANVLSRGLLGSTGDVVFVASPMYKSRFDLSTGRCLDGESPSVRVWPIRVWGSTVEVLAVTGDDDQTGADPARTVGTHCPYCALQCAMRVEGSTTGDETVSLKIGAEADFPVNEGRMCIKGWSAGALLGHRDRLRQPLIRNDHGDLKPASWEAALSELARRLTSIRDEHGPAAVGVFGSGALTNEKAYLLGKFARVALGTPNIDYNGRFCMASAAAAQNRSFGIDRGLPFPLADIAEADTLVLWGANPADTMPPLMQWVERMRRRGGRLVVVDPRRTETAALADIHLQPYPGTDLAVALGLLHLAVTDDLIDEVYLARRTTGWNGVRESVQNWSPDRVKITAGIDITDLRAAAAAIGRPGLTGRGASMLITGRGPEQQSKGVDTVTAGINLMLALGQVGRRAGGYGCLTGQGNGQGGREHGQKADQLAGYRSISDSADRATIARVWGIDPEQIPGPGLSATEMIASIGTNQGLRALLVAGSNLMVAAPDRRHTEDRLAQLDVLAVLDAFPTETARLADFVLPVTQWAEEDGTTTNLEGRVIRRRRAVAPPSGVRSDIEVISDLAGRLGQSARFAFDRPQAVFEELRRASSGGRSDYSGITYDRLDAEPGVFWPCPSTEHPGTPRLFADRFAHADGRARLVPVTYRPAAEAPDAEFPIALTTGRNREHYNSGSQTRRVPRLRDARPEPLLEIHPDLAAEVGLQNGSTIVVESRRGRAIFRTHLVDTIRPDTVFAPFHWGEDGSVNLVTSSALDPISRMPEFKVCAVRIRPADD